MRGSISLRLGVSDSGLSSIVARSANAKNVPPSWGSRFGGGAFQAGSSRIVSCPGLFAGCEGFSEVFFDSVFDVFVCYVLGSSFGPGSASLGGMDSDVAIVFACPR